MSDYITWKDVLNRYPVVDRVGGASEVGSAYVRYAERELEGMLTGFFTVPFSSNNLTAKDLAIDLTYMRISNLKSEDRKEFRDELMGRIQALKDGQASMMTTSGDVLQAVGGTIYSTTQNYEPVFGMGDTLDFHVDSGQLLDEENARG